MKTKKSRAKRVRVPAAVDMIAAEFGATAPTPWELANLATQLDAEAARDNPVEAVAKAAALWIAARQRAFMVERAELYRQAALAKAELVSAGELSEDAVMKLVGITTLKQFRTRAREFFKMDWAGSGIEEIKGLQHSRDAAFLNAGFPKPTKYKLDGRVVERPREWPKRVAEGFAAWLRADRSQKGRIGAAVLHGKSADALRK